MSSINIMTKTDAVLKDIKKEVVKYPNGTRRESTVYPNGVRKDRVYYPDGNVKESIINDRRSSSDHYQRNHNRRHSSPDVNKVGPMKSQSHSLGAASARKESAPPRKKSLVNFVAPPLQSREEVPKCCVCLNIRIAGFIIGFIELVLLAVALFGISHLFIETASDPEPSSRSSGNNYRPTISRTGLMVGSVISVFLFFLAILLMFLGLWKRKTNLIVPHMVVQAFSILGAIGGIVVTSIAIGVMRSKQSEVDKDGDNDNQTYYYFCVGVLVFSIFVFLFELYAFLVVRNCARFFNVEEPEAIHEEMMERGVYNIGGPPPAWH